jgi:hypothetical protein
MAPEVGDMENDGVENPAVLAVAAVNEKSA